MTVDVDMRGGGEEGWNVRCVQSEMVRGDMVVVDKPSSYDCRCGKEEMGRLVTVNNILAW